MNIKCLPALNRKSYGNKLHAVVLSLVSAFGQYGLKCLILILSNYNSNFIISTIAFYYYLSLRGHKLGFAHSHEIAHDPL